MTTPITLTPIGTLHSCYKEKFGIPRQPGLVRSATATLELTPPFNDPEALRGLHEFSHIWIIFMFHQSQQTKWKATVRPPRLGGNERLGVFATRSNFRPNPIGLSVVELQHIKGSSLTLSGGDFLDGTPVLDIKPYIPYADRIAEAKGAFAASPPIAENEVHFSPKAKCALQQLENKTRPALHSLIKDMLTYNPRPAYQTDQPGRQYGTQIFDLEIRWTQQERRIEVVSIQPQP